MKNSASYPTRVFPDFQKYWSNLFPWWILVFFQECWERWWALALRAGPRGESSGDRPHLWDPFDPGPRHPASHRRRLLRQDLLLGREHQGVPRSRRTVPWGGLWRGARLGGPDHLLPQLRHSRLPAHGRPDHEASGPELFLATYISLTCHAITRFFWWILISLTQSCLTSS